MEEAVSDILRRMMDLSPETMSRFYEISEEYMKKEYSCWFYAKMCRFVKETDFAEKARFVGLLKELADALHESVASTPMYELLSLDKSECFDDSFVFGFIREMQKSEQPNPEFRDLKSPYKTRGISLCLLPIPLNELRRITLKYGDSEHPYILSEISSSYIQGKDIISALPFLYRCASRFLEFPCFCWNNEMAIMGAANTFRYLVIMANYLPGFAGKEICRKIFKLYFLFVSRLVNITTDEEAQQACYVNRATLDLDAMAYSVFPLGIDPKTLYISDMYYAHYCNETAEAKSYASGWKYNLKSLTYYQHESLWPNDTGGYVDMYDGTYMELVQSKHSQANIIAYSFYQEYKNGKLKITKDELDSFFKAIDKECRYNYKNFCNRVLGLK